MAINRYGSTLVCHSNRNLLLEPDTGTESHQLNAWAQEAAKHHLLLPAGGRLGAVQGHAGLVRTARTGGTAEL